MTTQDAQADKPADKIQSPVEMTGKRPVAWAIFFAVVVAVLVVDLGLKAWSFENVAQTPVRVQTAEAGGPEVLVPSLDGEQWLAAHEIGLTPDPTLLPPHDAIVVVPGLLSFRLTLNTGAVFGTGKGGRPFFIGVSILAVIVILVLVYRSPADARLHRIGLALIFGGAMGNLYDRVMFSAVRDMLHMLPSTGLWPWIFNPADVALIAGVGSVLLVSWVSEYRRGKEEKLAKQAAN